MFEIGDPVRDKHGITGSGDVVGVVLEFRPADMFPYVVDMKGKRLLFRECELEKAKVE
jgi:hypothetical protein